MITVPKTGNPTPHRPQTPRLKSVCTTAAAYYAGTAACSGIKFPRVCFHRLRASVRIGASGIWICFSVSERQKRKDLPSRLCFHSLVLSRSTGGRTEEHEKRLSRTPPAPPRFILARPRRILLRFKFLLKIRFRVSIIHEVQYRGGTYSLHALLISPLPPPTPLSQAFNFTRRVSEPNDLHTHVRLRCIATATPLHGDRPFPGGGGGKPARALPRWVPRGNVFVKMRPRGAGLPRVCEARRVGWSLPFLSFYLFYFFY